MAVHKFERPGRLGPSVGGLSLDTGDGGGNDGGMEERVKKLEATLTTLQQDVAVMRANYATKADVEAVKTSVAEAKAAIIMWVVGAIFLAQLLPGFLKKMGW
ncbi:hypothetical protein KDW20_33700 [Burkholderia cenocepacia]|uniref:hypothetical protein n=1 Tax=Burkholderia cenocepacia TaxID=95486 RepID=UPI000F591A13|nr:hypothetical protein [Burkholderia cenocepacia]MBR8380737.1 hypothetical protein [Burkholderia cenocepacia]